MTHRSKVANWGHLALLLGALASVPVLASPPLVFVPAPTPPVSSAQVAALSAQLTTQSAQLSSQSAQLSAQSAQLSTLSTAVAGKQSKVVYNVKDYGAVGNGTTDDAPAINACGADAAAHGGGEVIFPPTAAGYGIRSSVHCQSYVYLKFIGSRLVLLASTNFIDSVSSIPNAPNAYLTAQPDPTVSTITVNSTASVPVGAEVLLQVGQGTYDQGEPDTDFFAKVLSKTSTTLTLDRPFGYTFPSASNGAAGRFLTGDNPAPYSFADVQSLATVLNGMGIADSVAHLGVYVISNYCHDFGVEGLYMDNANADGSIRYPCSAGLAFNYCQFGHFVSISGSNTGPCLIGGQYDDNLTFENVSLLRSFAGQTPSFGNGTSFAECHNIVINGLNCENFQYSAVKAEAGATVRITGLKIVNSFPLPDGSHSVSAGTARDSGNASLIQCLGNAKVTVSGMRVEGNGNCTLYSASANSHDQDCIISDLDWAASAPPIISDLGILSGRVSLDNTYLTGLTLKDTKEVSVNAALNTTTQTALTLPLGVIKSIRYYMSAVPSSLTAVLGSIDAAHLRNLFTAGKTVPLQNIGLGNGYTVNTSLSSPLTLYLYPNGTIPSGITARADVVYWPIPGIDDGMAGRLLVNPAFDSLSAGAISASGAASIAGDATLGRHLLTAGAAPTPTVSGTATSGSTVVMAGTDTSGTVTFTAGSGSAQGAAAIFYWNYASNYSAAPHVYLFPLSTASAKAAAYCDISNTTGAEISIANALSAPGVVLSYNYFVVQ